MRPPRLLNSQQGCRDVFLDKKRKQTLEVKSSPSRHSPMAPVAPIKTALIPRGSSEDEIFFPVSPPSAIFV